MSIIWILFMFFLLVIAKRHAHISVKSSSGMRKLSVVPIDEEKSMIRDLRKSIRRKSLKIKTIKRTSLYERAKERIESLFPSKELDFSLEEIETVNSTKKTVKNTQSSY